jgi:DNA-binding transcriptional ArsR family regulator
MLRRTISELANSEMSWRRCPMLETTASVCRAIASEPKLFLLHQLAVHGELDAAELARRTGLAPDGVCRHVQRLGALGLVERRRSGAHVFCSLPPAEREHFGASAVALLQRAWRDTGWATSGWDEDGVVHLRSDVPGHVSRQVARATDVVFDAATAFGNVRRLQLLRLVIRAGPCAEERIVAELRMSPAACWRHTDKLARRGVLSRQGSAGWLLSRKQRTPLHATLLSLVVARLS